MVKSIRIWFLAIVGLAVAALPAMAGNNSGQAFTTWPDTGQTKCYDGGGAEILPCPAEGAAFYGQDAQYPGPAHSYADLGSGTIQDNVTGLVWEQKTNMDGTANYADPHDADNTYTWCDTNATTNGGHQGTCETNDTMDFLGTLNGVNFGSHNDWRLPTIKELATLVDLGRGYPAIDPLFAATTQSSYYWSSTTYAYFIPLAWLVYFINGDDDYGYKSSGCYVRAVRGGQ